MGILCAVIFFLFFFFFFGLCIFFLNGRDGRDGECGRMDLFCTLLLLSSVCYSFEERVCLFQNALRGPSRLAPYHLTHTHYTHHTHTPARVRNQYISTRVKDYAATTDPTHIATKERFLRHQHVVNTSCVATNPAHIATKKRFLRHQRIECRVRDM
jgi:hypothetical protein